MTDVPTGGPVCPWCGGQWLRILHRTSCQQRVWKLARCSSCGLHFTDPPPSASDITAFYSGDYHGSLRTTGASEGAFGDKYSRYVLRIKRHVSSGSSLDVGCSTGLLCHMLRAEGYDAEGVEPNPESARWGTEHYGVPIRVGTLEDLEASHKLYDLVTLTDVLEHTAQPLQTLRLTSRLLTPGGYALVTCPDVRSGRSMYCRFLAWIAGRPWLWLTRQIPFHVWEFTLPTARRLFERAGFEVMALQRCESIGTCSDLRLRLLMLPLFPLRWPVLARRFGTQMEFILRKRGPAPCAVHGVIDG